MVREENYLPNHTDPDGNLPLSAGSSSGHWPMVGPRGRCGHTPQVRVFTSGSGRVSLAGLLCIRPGRRPRLIYRTRVHPGRAHEQKGFTEADYIRLLVAPTSNSAVRSCNLNIHHSKAMRRLIAARPWLTVFRLPAHAPELNPVEGGSLVAPDTIPGETSRNAPSISSPCWSSVVYDGSSTARTCSQGSSPEPDSISDLPNPGF